MILEIVSIARPGALVKANSETPCFCKNKGRGTPVSKKIRGHPIKSTPALKTKTVEGCGN